jgi:hypothetical protein
MILRFVLCVLVYDQYIVLGFNRNADNLTAISEAMKTWEPRRLRTPVCHRGLFRG